MIKQILILALLAIMYVNCADTCTNYTGGCQACQNGSCLACDNGKDVSSNCNCETGYYQFTDSDTKVTTCEACDASCENCSGGNSTQCTTCPSKKGIVLNKIKNTCVCDKGYISTGNVDAPCKACYNYGTECYATCPGNTIANEKYMTCENEPTSDVENNDDTVYILITIFLIVVILILTVLVYHYFATLFQQVTIQKMQQPQPLTEQEIEKFEKINQQQKLTQSAEIQSGHNINVEDQSNTVNQQQEQSSNQESSQQVQQPINDGSSPQKQVKRKRRGTTRKLGQQQTIDLNQPDLQNQDNLVGKTVEEKIEQDLNLVQNSSKTQQFNLESPKKEQPIEQQIEQNLNIAPASNNNEINFDLPSDNIAPQSNNNNNDLVLDSANKEGLDSPSKQIQTPKIDIELESPNKQADDLNQSPQKRAAGRRKTRRRTGKQTDGQTNE